MTMKRNDKASRKKRQQAAFDRFYIDPERAKVDKEYRARKEHEAVALARKLGKEASHG